MLQNIISLSNVPVGDQYKGVALNQKVSLRFLAKSQYPQFAQTVLAAARLYHIWKIPGYGAGTLGKLQYDLYSDNNGVPGTLLVTASLVIPQDAPTGNGGFPLICFPPTSLTVGQWYHIVVSNVDPDSADNWQSLDFLLCSEVNDQTPSMQLLRHSDAVTGWVAPNGGCLVPSPVLLVYADGTEDCEPGYQINSSTQVLAGSAYGFPGA